MEEAQYLVDPSTGEAIPIIDSNQINSISVASDEEKIVAMKLKGNHVVATNMVTPKKPKRHKMAWGFTMLNVDDLRTYILEVGLSDNEMAFITFMVAFVDFNGAIVDPKTGQYLSTSEIPKMIRWSKTKVIEVLNMLEKRDILKRFVHGKRKCVMVNPDMMYRGDSTVHKRLMDEYRNL